MAFTPHDPIGFADRKSRYRPLLSAFVAIYFLAIQPFAGPRFDAGATPARGLGWALQAAVLLLLLLPVVGLMWGRRIRELINDDVARLNLRTATTAGFWIAMVLALGLFVLPASADWPARQALYLVVTPTVGASLLVFAWLEWRATRDG
jgi:hypothetical protein